MLFKKTVLVFTVFCFAMLAAAQQRTVTGTILDSKDLQPLAGVTVTLKGSSSSVVSSELGQFSISVPAAESILVFSSVGFTTQEAVLTASTSSLDITLQRTDSELGEVVVVGYSEKKRGELTSAVSVVSAEKLKDVTSNNVGSMLQGKVAGLQVVNSSGVPGAAPEIRLRGVSSINASQSPLFVVDGIIGGNYDPNDVESVTVLKDAGATAMYGSQANAGVIIVTTKKASGDKPRIEARVTTGFRTPDFGEMQMMNSRQLYEYQKELYRDYIPNEGDNSYKIDLLKFYEERPLSIRDQNTDWLDEIFSPALLQNYYVSVAGRTDKSSHYLGVSFYNEEGTFKNTGFKRLNLRANTQYKLGNRVRLTNNINLSGATGRSYDYNDIYYAYLNLPWDNPYDSSGSIRYVDGNSLFKWWSRDKINPLHTIDNSDHPYKSFDLNYDMLLDVDITPWLTFSTSNRIAASYSKGSNFFSPVVAGTYHDDGYLAEENVTSYGGISNNLLRFKFKTGDHAISGLAGIIFEGGRSEFTGASGKGLPLGLSVLNVVSNTQQVSGSYSQSLIQSYLGQVNYSFRNKYFLTGSYRVDGSSAFPPSNRYASFPAVSAAWLISEEPFFGAANATTLKLRASYGVTGTQDIGAGRYLGLYSLNAQYNNQVGATPLQLPSPNLTWESKHQLNVGIDLGLLKGRLSIIADAYQNITRNLLLQVSQPLSVGFEQRWDNVGEIHNQGVELTISSVNVQTGDFSWSTDFTINYNKNELQGLPDPIIKTGSWAISQIYRNGGNLYEFYMPKWAGVDVQTGAPLWELVTKDGNGNITSVSTTSDYSEASYQEVGSALPKFQGGLNNTISWRGLSLNVNAYFIQGNKVFSNNLRFVMNDGSEPYLNQIVLPDGYSIWKQPGDIATNPSPQNSANSTETSSRYLMDGSFISIRNVGLSYSLPTTWMKRAGLKEIRVGVTADNLHTFTSFVGQDPQTTITPGIYVTPGVSDFKYPNNRQFLFNINVRF